MCLVAQNLLALCQGLAQRGCSWAFNKHRKADEGEKKPPACSSSSKLTLLLCWVSVEQQPAGGEGPDSLFRVLGGESVLPSRGKLSPQTLIKLTWAPTYGCAKPDLGHCSSTMQLEKGPWSVQGP